MAAAVSAGRFHLKKTAFKAHRMLSSTYGEAVLSERTCREWFHRFKTTEIYTLSLHDALPIYWKRENFGRFRIGGITCRRLMPKARRIGRIIGSDLTSHFETPQSHGNDSEARKLGSVRVEIERPRFCSMSTVGPMLQNR